MINHNLSKYCELINDQVQARSLIRVQLAKVEALMKVTLETSFLQFSAADRHHYLWALSDIIEEISDLNNQQFKCLLSLQKSADAEMLQQVLVDQDHVN